MKMLQRQSDGVHSTDFAHLLMRATSVLAVMTMPSL